MKNNYDAIIIGSGLGGLLSGAILVKKGYKPLILEKLSFFGGKFSSINYNGYEVPTGAFHALPGGKAGNVGKLIKYLNLDIEIVEASPSFIATMNKDEYIIPINPKDYKYIFAKNSFLKVLSFKEKIELIKIIYIIMYTNCEIPEIPFYEFLKRHTGSYKILGLIDKIIGFTNSTTIENSSAIDVVTSIRLQNRNFEGVIKGGCKSLILQLIKNIEENGGTFLSNIKVNEILLKDQKAIGVSSDKCSYFSDLIISNVGPKQTIDLLKNNCPGWLIEKENKSTAVFGIAYSIGSNEPLLKSKSVYLPLNAKKICGYLPISNFDSDLSPEDKHYILAYQFFDDNEDINDAINLGKLDLLRLFPQISDENIFSISVYKDDWPATFTQQRLGQTGSQRYPIKLKEIENLYMIGHDSEGYGFAAEIIGSAVLKLNEIIGDKTIE